jgi:murein DD-endopeptidase MepM/ murein hydrolase activator NlpD
MKKALFVLFLIILAGFFYILAKNIFSRNNSPTPAGDLSKKIPVEDTPAKSIASENESADASQKSSELTPPLDRAAERATKKPFGIFITPQNSPIQPEIFRGYHTGTDFEIFPEEENIDISVRAICDGKLSVKKTASGYGGVAVQNCEIDGEAVSVVYGHLKLSSISKNVGGNLEAGEVIGILGKAYSPETDGERKHLHLGIHKGTSISILGYIAADSQLSDWLDPCEFVCW